MRRILIIVGPPKTGKTETAKFIAEGQQTTVAFLTPFSLKLMPYCLTVCDGNIDLKQHEAFLLELVQSRRRLILTMNETPKIPESLLPHITILETRHGN